MAGDDGGDAVWGCWRRVMEKGVVEGGWGLVGGAGVCPNNANVRPCHNAQCTCDGKTCPRHGSQHQYPQCGRNQAYVWKHYNSQLYVPSHYNHLRPCVYVGQTTKLSLALIHELVVRNLQRQKTILKCLVLHLNWSSRLINCLNVWVYGASMTEDFGSCSKKPSNRFV